MRALRSCWRIGLFVLAAVAVPAAAAPHTTPSVATLGAPPEWATVANDVGRAADAPIAHLTVELARTPEQQRAFDQLRAEQDTPGSRHYHQWLSPGEIGARFGASAADVAAVTSWLTSQGLKVLRVANARSFIEISGSVRTAEAAFGVELHRFRVGDRVLRAPDRTPTVPAALARVVTRVTGLSERTSAPQHHVAGRGSPQGVDQFGQNFVGVNDFATIYDLGPVYAQQLDGSGQVIGIIGRSRVFGPDITRFGTDNSATLAPFTTIIPSTGVNPGSACGSTSCGSASTVDDQFEATLDVTRVTSIATGAKVELIVSATDAQGDDGVGIALGFAIDQFGSGADANILTVSFGLCEQQEGSAADTQAVDTLYQQAAMQGQTLFVSAGDAGAAGCDRAFQTPPASQQLGVNALCVSPASTCAGGTEFADSGSPATYWSGSGAALAYIPEGAWNEPAFQTTNGTSFFAQGGGGGISTVLPLPTYQTGLGPSGNTFRLVPDVSLTSACHDYYFLCFAANGTPCSPGSDDFGGACGTSAAAPSLAAIMSLAFERLGGGRQGAANPGFYALGDPATHVFHDVTSSSSGVGNCSIDTPSLCNNSDPGPASFTIGALPGYAVGAGYDMATGLGSLDVNALVAAWGTSLTLTPSSLSIAAGQSGTTDAVAMGFTGTPTFACNGLPSFSACQFTASGSDSATVTIVTSQAAATGGATSEVDGRGGTGWLLAALALALAFAMRLRPRPRARAVACGLAFAAAAAVASCGGSHETADSAVDAPVALAGNYSVVVTATSGQITAAATLNLTITP